VVAGPGDQDIVVRRQLELVRGVLLARRGDVLKREHVIPVEQVRVLEADTNAVLPRLRGAGVVQSEAESPGALVLHAHVRAQVPLVRAALQHYGRLLHRALVREPQLACQSGRVERLPVDERGQAAADVCCVEVAIPLDRRTGQPPFDHA
jgi:hypothetical protein